MDSSELLIELIKEAKKSKTDLKASALLVKDGKIIFRSHRKKGEPTIHAEEDLFNKCNFCQEYVLYLSLEPCCYRNSVTKSCCDLIINSKVKKVIIGMKDINKKICSKSVNILKNAGINVVLNSKMQKQLMDLLGEKYIVKHIKQ